MSGRTRAPTPIRPRAYAGADDLRRMQEVIRQGWRRDGKLTQVHPGDLEWWRASVGGDDVFRDRAALWETRDGRTVGWTVYSPPAELDWFLHPRHRSEGLRRAMLGWFEEKASGVAPGTVLPDRLTVWAAGCDPRLMWLLGGEGYERSPDWFVHRVRDLAAADADLPGVDVPAGYVVRNVEGDADVPGRVLAHVAAFAPSRMTEDAHRLVMASPSYRPELDVVVVAPDGAIGAFCLAWFDARTGVVLLEPVGTHPDHRRKGLARAACTEAIRRAAGLGARAATVLAWSEDAAPNRLYESVGFREVMHSYRYRKDVARSEAAA